MRKFRLLLYGTGILCAVAVCLLLHQESLRRDAWETRSRAAHDSFERAAEARDEARATFGPRYQDFTEAMQELARTPSPAEMREQEDWLQCDAALRLYRSPMADSMNGERQRESAEARITACVEWRDKSQASASDR